MGERDAGELVGNWQVDRQRFPAGLVPFRERVHERGMLGELWEVTGANRRGPHQTGKPPPLLLQVAT